MKQLNSIHIHSISSTQTGQKDRLKIEVGKQKHDIDQ